MKRFLKALIYNKCSPLKEPEQIYIISYPKTGRTWLRALIGKSLCEKNGLSEERMMKMNYITAASGLPRISFLHDEAAMLDKKSYQELSSDKSKYKNKKVLLLSRDVKDTLVSAYFQATKRINVFNGNISEFIRSHQYGVLKILMFYKYWYEKQHVPKDFLFIKYENLHKEPDVVLEQTLKFIGVQDIDKQFIDSAIEYCSFNNLKKAEGENRFHTAILSPANLNDPESFKVRKGLIGNYDEYLSEKDIRYIDRLIEKHGCEFTNYK